MLNNQLFLFPLIFYICFFILYRSVYLKRTTNNLLDIPLLHILSIFDCWHFFIQNSFDFNLVFCYFFFFYSSDFKFHPLNIDLNLNIRIGNFILLSYVYCVHLKMSKFFIILHLFFKYFINL